MKLKTTECNGIVYHHSPSVYFRCAPRAENSWVVIHRRFAACVESGVWNQAAEKQWHDREWLESIPGCASCREHYAELAKSIDWTSAKSASDSMFRIHNQVSREYADKQEITRQQFEALYFQQPSMDDCCVAVTSLSPAPDSVDRQRVCLDSWQRFGLSVVAVQSKYDPPIADLYPQVSSWVLLQESGSPRIKQMANVAISEHTTILLMNSDLELHGQQSIVRDAIIKGTAIGVRHNFRNHWWTCAIEPYGIDAFSFTPQAARELPDLPFRIGKPWWDFWLLEHTRNQHTSWITDPLFFHKSHELRWNEADWDHYASIFAAELKKTIRREDVDEFRREFSRKKVSTST